VTMKKVSTCNKHGLIAWGKPLTRGEFDIVH